MARSLKRNLRSKRIQAALYYARKKIRTVVSTIVQGAIDLVSATAAGGLILFLLLMEEL